MVVSSPYSIFPNAGHGVLSLVLDLVVESLAKVVL